MTPDNFKETVIKLATLKQGGRDGTLVVVSRDLERAARATGIAPTLQAAIDDWGGIAPRLQELYERLQADRVDDAFALSAHDLAAPFPRAYQWVDGSAYVTHVELVRKARGAEMPPSFWTDPLVYQGGSDDFIGPRDDIRVPSEEHGIDMEAEVAVVTDDVPMGIDARDAEAHIKLLMLVNDVSLRNLVPGELAKGFGFYQSKPATAFSPVAVTPDELGDAWRGAKLHLPLVTYLNDELLGEPQAGEDMTFSFADLIAHVAKTRNLGAGTIVGSGTVSNTDRSRGSSCLAERRMLETLEHGSARTPFMKFGDRVRIEMLDPENASIFGAIDQRVVEA
ncbi:fumarylacetoacetate hydrolase family protein [soil metagenome]